MFATTAGARLWSREMLLTPFSGAFFFQGPFVPGLQLSHNQGLDCPEDAQARRGSPSAMPPGLLLHLWLRDKVKTDPSFLKVLKIPEESSKDRDDHRHCPLMFMHMRRWHPGVLTPSGLHHCGGPPSIHYPMPKDGMKTQLALAPSLLLLDGPQREFLGKAKVCAHDFSGFPSNTLLLVVGLGNSSPTPLADSDMQLGGQGVPPTWPMFWILAI